MSNKKDAAPLSNPRGYLLHAYLLLLGYLMLSSLPAYAIDPNSLPQNGSITAGGGSISSIGNQMRVTQNSQNMIVNWQSFNVGKDASITFAQPNSQSSVLNRVMSADPSYIMGNLTSNGRVFLINPSGVLFGNGAQVNVGSLVASTLDIDNNNFMSGKYIFEKNGSAGSIVNQGNMKAADGGFVALLAPEVINQGLISARLGTVALAAGDKVSLDIKGDGLLSFHIDKAALSALTENRGLIQADGGQVILGARSAGDLMATVVNNSGVIEANSMTERNGVIILDGGPQGIVKNEGSLIASGFSSSQTGGIVKVLGDKVGIMSGAFIDASGAVGGGEILVGGNYQGNGPESNASVTYVDQAASIKANAIESGNGGRAVVWANDTTRFYGAIEAKGGANSGDGGFVETSGKRNLDFQGSVNTLAPHGKAGTLLLDPQNVTISAVSGPTTNINSTGSPFSPTGPNAVLLVSNLETQLGLSNTIVNTGSSGLQAGTITVSAASPISWTSGNSLTLAANGAVSIYSPITSTGAAGVSGGNFAVTAGGTVLINSSITTTGGTGSGTSGGNISVSTTIGDITIAPGVALNSSGNNGGGGINHHAGSISLSTGPGGTLTTGSGGAAISALGYDGGNSNTIGLTADSMVINGALNANRINFTTSSPGQGISLGSVGGGLLLNSTVASHINAPNIYISTGSGNIVHTGDFTPSASSGGVFSVVTSSGSITDTTGGSSNLGPGGNASNYILSGASIGGAGNPIMTIHSPILNLTSAGSIYVYGDAATGITSGLTVTSSSSGTGTFSFSNITNAVPSITTSGNVYTVSGTNSGSAMSFSFTGNAPVNVGTGSLGLASNGGSLSVSASGSGSNISVQSGGGGVVTSGSGSATLNADGTTTINNNVNAGSGGISLTGGSGITYAAGTIQTVNNGNIAFNSATTLTSPLTTNSGSGDTSFMSTIAGGTNALVVNSTGTTLFNSSVVAGSLITDVGGTTQLNGNITTGGVQTYNEAVQVQSGITLATSNSNVTFASTVDSQAAENNTLTVSSGSGAVNMSGTIGATQALGALSVNNISGSGAINLVDIGGSAAGVTGATAIGNANTSAIVFNGTVYNAGQQTYGASAGQNLSLAGGATTTFTSTNGAIVFNTANMQLGDGSNLVVNSNGGAISALKIDGSSSEDVTLNASGGTVAVGAIGTQTANGVNTIALTGASGITLNGNITTDNATGNSVTISGPTTLGTGVTVNTAAGVGGVAFSSTIDGAQSLAILAGSGNVGLAGNVGANTALTQLTASGVDIDLHSVKTSGIQTYTASRAITTNGSYVSSGSVITFAGNTILGGDTTVDTTNSSGIVTGAAVLFNGVLNSDGIGAPSTLEVAAGYTGDITFNEVVGANNALGGVTLNNARNVIVPTFNSASLTQLSGTGVTDLNGLVTTAGNVSLTGAAFNVSSGINAGGSIAFVNSGLLTTTSNLTAGAAGFTQSGSGLNSIGGNISTAGGGIAFATGVTLTTDVLLSTSAGGSGNVSLNSTVDGSKSLVINTGGITSFGGIVGGTTALTALTTDAPGSTAINGTAVTTTAAQTYNDAVTLGSNDTLTGVNVTFASTINGAKSLLVNDSGTTTFNGMVGGTTALTSLTTDAPGATVINGGGTITTGAQTYNDVVILGANTSLSGVNITLASTVNGAHNLIVNDSGTTSFNGVVGGTTALTSVTTDALGTTAINGEVINTTAAQTYNDAVTLGANTSLNGINVNLASTVNGARSLRVNDSGTTTFGGIVGGIAALTSVTTDAPGATAINGGEITTTAAQTYNDVVTLAADDVLTGINVTFAKTINGARSLTVNDAGQTILAGQIGQLTPLVDLTVNTAGGLVIPTTTLSSNMSLTTGGGVSQVGAVVIGNNTHIDAGLNPITLTNGSNDFVGVVGSLNGTSVGIKGSVVSLTGSDNMNLGQIEASASSVTINAGASIYNGLAGVTNVTSVASSMLGGNGGVIGTISAPITVNLPSVTANATKEQGGVSIDLAGSVGDNKIWLVQTPPGLVFLNGMILNAGQVPGVPQDAYSTALAVLEQSYLTGNGNVVNVKPSSSINDLSGFLYPTDDVNTAFAYGPYIYKIPGKFKLKDGGVKLPVGVQQTSMKQ